jgi:hypothetical protein
LASVVSLTHTPEQSVSPLGHAHCPKLHTCPPEHGVEAIHVPDWLHVSGVLPLHACVPGAHASQAPLTQAGVAPVHDVEDALYTHPWPSERQETAAPLEHMLPTLVHVASTLHVHCPSPAAPVQVW